MVRNLVLLFDGTWSDPNRNSNVHQLHQLLLPEAPNQKVKYQSGIGTVGLRFIPGITGLGLSGQICEGYQWLATHYQPGVQICLFGFSRGAYSARSLAGMIRKCGLIPQPDEEKVTQAYQFYRQQSIRPSDLQARDWRARRNVRTPGIHFLGVWDTVGRLGIPTMGALKWADAERFHDTELSSQVAHAYHAIALDEHRRDYTVPVWSNKKLAPGQKVEQRWFVGAHSDVGGGYKKNNELALISLAWMQQKAQSAGIRFTVSVRVPGETYLGKRHDSYGRFLGGVYRLFSPRYYRPLGEGLNETIDPSVWQRMRDKASYTPWQFNSRSPVLP
jgi:uncharacterized protein (DUF2235 family)